MRRHTPSAMVVARLFGLCLASGIQPVAAGSNLAPPVPAEIAGAHHGQAVAASRICPGAQLTAGARALEAQYSQQDAVTFAAASKRIIAAWEQAFACVDVDPAQSREINGCRRAKILSCTAAWSEVGPDGSAIAGLLEFRPQDR